MLPRGRNDYHETGRLGAADMRYGLFQRLGDFASAGRRQLQKGQSSELARSGGLFANYFFFPCRLISDSAQIDVQENERR